MHIRRLFHFDLSLEPCKNNLDGQRRAGACRSDPGWWLWHPKKVTKKTMQEREEARLFLHFLGAARTTWVDKRKSHELGGLRPCSKYSSAPCHSGPGCPKKNDEEKQARKGRGKQHTEQASKQHPEQAAGHRLFLHFLGAARTPWADKWKSHELGGLRPALNIPVHLVTLVLGGGCCVPGK